MEFIDNEKNRYFLDAFLKIKENILLGKDIKINLRNDKPILTTNLCQK